MVQKRLDREESFLALLSQNQKILYKVARAYCSSALDREDLIAEMTAALWKSFDRYDESRRFSTWMYRVALNVAISFYRSERRRSDQRSAEDVARLELIEHEDEPDERIERLNAFVAGLGDIDKALMLLYLDEHSYKSIAAILGLSETNVATKLGRLKTRARTALAGDSPSSEGEFHGQR